MSYYIAPYTFDFEAAIIHADPGHVDVDCADLYDAIKEAQASVHGITYPVIAEASGLVDLGPGVAVGLTVELLGDWQFKFAPGNYIGRIAGGNLVGGPGGDPIAYTAGVQTLLIQSAASTVVTSGGSVPSAAAIRAEIDANSTKLDVPVSSRLAADSYTTPPTIANIRAELAAHSSEEVEAGLDERGMLRVIAALVAGNYSTDAEGVVTVLGLDGVTDRVTGTADGEDRTATFDGAPTP